MNAYAGWSVTPIGFLLVGFMNSKEKTLLLRIVKVVLFSVLLTAIWFIPTAILAFYAHIWGGGSI
jgi:hypothetical protein